MGKDGVVEPVQAAVRKKAKKKGTFGSPERRKSVEEMRKVLAVVELAADRASQGLVGMIKDMRDALTQEKPVTRSQKAMVAWLEKSPEKFMAKLEELEREQAGKVKVEEKDEGSERMIEIMDRLLGKYGRTAPGGAVDV